MGPSKELTALLFELERVPSPLDRLQVVARAWRSVRALDRGERKELARRIGFDGAEELLERLAARGGLAPATLLEMLRRVRRSDPAALDSLVKDLTSPGQRGSAVLEGLRLAGELLEPPPEDGPGPEGEDDLEAPAMASDDAPEPPAPPPPAAEVLPAQDPATPHRPRRPVPPPPRPTPAPPAAAPPRPAAAAPPPRPRPRPVQASPAASPPPPPPTPAPSEPQESVPVETSRLRALRWVHRLLADAAGERELEAAVLAIPDGWARRRAVQAALRNDRPSGLADALRLISSLGREHDRVWCLAALLNERPLDPGGLERSLELVSSGSARDRLTRLAARRGR